MKHTGLKRQFGVLALLLTAICIISACQSAAIQTVEKWEVFELSLQGPADGNPYMNNTLSAQFTNGSKTIQVTGFYDGDGTYKIRFSPDELGDWVFVTQSNIQILNNQTGSFHCIEPTGKNHGPLQITNTFYLEYADGTPFYAVGTTAYQWTSVKQSIQDQTMKTLANSPFNKIRMGVFPKSYSYGNDTEPWMLPFKRIDSLNDPTRPNYEFFQNFDKRIAQLKEKGIQADVILFHPYDKWGYYEMGPEMNEKYVRYMMARISAYSNVWWSLANEWDVPRIINKIDWERIGTLLHKEDPHQRFRGIHNWYYDESHFYDHNRPWVTHASLQTIFFFNAEKWRNKYQKPLLYDEMRYEGDVPSSWGRLSAQEMTSYFWKSGLSGVYGTHGDTFKNDSDQETEVRWWAKGGTLMGKSPERIAFFRKIMEEAPVTEMTPKTIKLSKTEIPDTIPDKIDDSLIKELNNNVYTFYKKGKYYLAYAADSLTTITLNLDGSRDYALETIDTWNMTISNEGIVGAGTFKYETKKPFMAFRLIAK